MGRKRSRSYSLGLHTLQQSFSATEGHFYTVFSCSPQRSFSTSPERRRLYFKYRLFYNGRQMSSILFSDATSFRDQRSSSTCLCIAPNDGRSMIYTGAVGTTVAASSHSTSCSSLVPLHVILFPCCIPLHALSSSHFNRGPQMRHGKWLMSTTPAMR